MKKKHELMKSRLFENNIPHIRPERPQELDGRTLTRIVNSFDAEAYLDPQGQLWIAKDKLHDILRTSKTNANAMFDEFEDVINIGDYKFVRAYEVMGKISKEIEEANSLRKGEYLSFSEQCLIAIRDSDRAKVKRARHSEKWYEEKKKLKSKRINKYSITTDELTGKKLIQKTAEFSHIRSSSLFNALSLDIENGLIVNKTTHEIITKENISHEDELKFLCEQKNWYTDWYDTYKKKFGNI
ncbi:MULTISPECIES: hypothetical protein [Lysinibacillus]|uniref:Uncharacterized protein n=1 Tax=Lysinibacillus capsici TaxID=2115968 RepID=A0ABY8KKA4_9BACI|nr:hypothetical protein [Lysinibacillus capsici]WGF39924.1 hypothetical protein QBO96_06560 [Lysinibacillus capsici]